MSGSLEQLVNHWCRLDILCCLDGDTLAVPQVGARINKPVGAVAYHLRLLEGREVVERVGSTEGEAATYTATLDKHPPWVAEAVAEHRESSLVTPEHVATVRAMAGMKCDGCKRLLRYRSEVVAVYDEDGEKQAKLITEDTPGSGEAASLRATSKYHPGCYDEARERDPSLPPIQG